MPILYLNSLKKEQKNEKQIIIQLNFTGNTQFG